MIEFTNRLWLSNASNIGIENKNGIDLVDRDYGVEMKSQNFGRYSNFTIHHYQIDLFRKDNERQELYWAFMLYTLDRPIKEVKNMKHYEKYVLNRDTWFVNWNFVRKFPVSHCKTASYVYVNLRDVKSAENFSKIEKDGGTLYVPKGTNL